ncbi:hypothetical protein OH807_23210 [Kitasatospora sp. NBC_01560]|uniref:hypothetical protein n=1 Tax=Kitasatospora sp. NBC_01560 TaxID=2975965 RepID=UPI0038680312
MRPGTAHFLVGAALVTLLALALVTVALGVVTALRSAPPDGDNYATRPDPRHRPRLPT